MVSDQGFVSEGDFSLSSRFRDLEEKQRLLKERVLLIGENLVDFRSEISKSVVGIKSTLDVFREDIDRLSSSVKRLSEEIEGKAKRSDLEILQRQARMFEPLKLTTPDDVKKIIMEFRS